MKLDKVGGCTEKLFGLLGAGIDRIKLQLDKLVKLLEVGGSQQFILCFFITYLCVLPTRNRH